MYSCQPINAIPATAPPNDSTMKPATNKFSVAHGFGRRKRRHNKITGGRPPKKGVYIFVTSVMMQKNYRNTVNG